MDFSREKYIKQIMGGLEEIALEDGKITADEKQFI